MQYALSLLVLVAACSSAARIPRTTCTFSLTATGTQSGQVGQLNDGQNRVGGSLPRGTYSINDGQIVDGQGRGCILTPPTAQFQCDVGATPTGGFFIDSKGVLSHNGNPQFYACPATEYEYNIYTYPVKGQAKCVNIGLIADGCFAPPSTSKASPPPGTTIMPPTQPSTNTTKVVVTVTSAQPTTVKVAQPPYRNSTTTVSETRPASTITNEAPVTIVQTSVQQVTIYQTLAPATVTKFVTITAQNECPVQTAPPQSPVETHPAPAPSTKETAQPPKPTDTHNSCPTNLDGEYQYPHLIVPVNKDEPHRAYGTQYNGKITSSISTIFNFDIPASYIGTCSLVFLFPVQADLETSSFTFSGDGGVSFKKLKTVATQETTYDTVGEIERDLGVQTLTPGSKATISTFACPGGQRISFEASATGNIDFDYFQDYNPSPIGAYITTC